METRVAIALGLAVVAAVVNEAASPRSPHTTYEQRNVGRRPGRDLGQNPRIQFSQRGFGGGAFTEDVPLVARFDKDGDGRLNATERRAARTFAESQGFRQIRGGRGEPYVVSIPDGPPVDPATIRPVPASVPLYDPLTLRTIFLQFENADWERELMAFKDTDVRVPATVRVDGETYPDVGVQFHGNSSFRSVPQGLKHSMTLAMDFVHDKQRLGGYRTLTLLNSHEDPTLLRAVLYLHIARAYLAAPKANFVHVVINGESWGIYPNVQHFNKDFAREWFDGDGGARWKVPGSPGARGGLEYVGEDPAAYRQSYEIKTDDRPDSWQALIELARAIDVTPVDRLDSILAKQLDIDGVLRFLALDNALVNNDGYWTRASDYDILLDPTGTFHLIPYDVNETFPTRRGMGGRGGTVDLDPLVGFNDRRTPLRSKLLANPVLRAKYLAYVRDIATTWLDWARLGPIAAQYHALIRPLVETDPRKLDSFEAFDTGLDELRSFVDRRRARLLTDPVR